MRQPDDESLFADMLVAAREVRDLTQGITYNDFQSNRILVLAIERLIQIIGEAGFRLSSAGRERIPALPWRDIIAMRHRLVHGYREIRVERAWDVVEWDLDELIEALEAVLDVDAGLAPE